MQRWLGERLGSGDGERKTLQTRQIAFEPLPASVLFGFLLAFGGLSVHASAIEMESVPARAASISTLRAWEAVEASTR